MDSSVNSLYPIHQIGSDGFSWWIGQVETNKQDDPKRSGRYRVRIIGQHLKTGDNATPTSELPWAHIMMPVTTPFVEGGTSGASPGLKRGCFVCGFYLDNDKQKPIIMGSLGGTKSATKESQDDPGSGPLNFTAVKDPEVVPQRDRSLDNQSGKDSGGGNTDKGVVDSDRADTPKGAPPILVAAYGKHSETNPTGGKSCVVIANPNCGQEKNLKSGLTRLMGDLLAANQASGGNIGDFYVSKINGMIYNQVSIARYHTGRVVRLVKSFISRSKSEIVKGIRGGIKLLNDALLTEEVATGGYKAVGPYKDPDKAFVPITEKSNRFQKIKKIFDEVFKELGCSIADMTERIAKFITDLILGYLTDVFNNAACFIDTLVDGILNEIVAQLEAIIDKVLGPITALLEAIAAPLNLIGGIVNSILGLLGITCTGPSGKCEPIQEKCVDCSDNDGQDDLDKLLDLLESGIGDQSLFVCDESKQVPQDKDTSVTFIGGVYDEPQQEPLPSVPPSETGEQDPPSGLTPTDPEDPIVPELPDDEDDDPVIPPDPEEDPPEEEIIPDPIPNGDPYFTIVADKSVYEEGETITYTITSTNVPNGTEVPLTLSGVDITSTDFVEGLTGTATISGVTTTTGTDADGNATTTHSAGTATFTRTITIDGDPAEIVRCRLDNFTEIFTDVVIDPAGTTDEIVLPPDLVAQSYEVTTDKTNYFEGEDVIVTVTTENVPDGTACVYAMTGVNVTPSDFVLNSLVGNFEINNNTATIVIGIQDDIEVENLESVTFLIVNKGADTTFNILADSSEPDAPEVVPTNPDVDPEKPFDPSKPIADDPITGPGGEIIEIPIKTPGGPYQSPPKVIITGEGYGAGAIALLDSNGFVTEVRVTRSGVNYKSNTPDANDLQCIIDSFTLISPGVGYTEAPKVLVDGVPDIAIAEIDDRGYVVSVRTSDRNARYTSMPKITFIGGGGGAGAKFLPNMSCLDNIGLETQGYAKIGTGKYIDCP